MATEIIPGATGTPLHLLHYGDGPALVLVHDLQATNDDWRPVARELTPARHSIVLNRRGRAPSGPLGPDYGMKTEVADLNAVLDHVASEIDPSIALFGHGFGGAICLLAALDRPDLRSLVLYEPMWPLAGPAAVEPLADAVDQGDLDEALVILLTTVLSWPADLVAQLPGTERWLRLRALVPTTLAELETADALPPTLLPLAEITTPTRVLLGANTPPGCPYFRVGQALTLLLPDAELHRLAGQQHLAHEAAPATLAEAILAGDRDR